MDVISVEHLSKTYRDEEGGNTQVLDDISFSVADHEILSLFGPNGCGKTTLINICANLLSTDKGVVKIFGDDPSNTIIGYIPQAYSESLFPWLTNLGNICFPLRLAGLGNREAREKATAFLTQLRIDIPLNNYPYESSGGQKQLTALARALVSSPSVLLADEPFSALDYTTRLEMQDKFLDIVSTGLQLPTIFVSHQIEDAIYTGDRLIVFSKQPARIVDDFEISLPRPRNREMTKSLEFNDLRARAIDSFLKGLSS